MKYIEDRVYILSKCSKGFSYSHSVPGGLDIQKVINFFIKKEQLPIDSVFISDPENSMKWIEVTENYDIGGPNA